MMDRIVTNVLKLEGDGPVLDRIVLSVGVCSLALSLVGTFLS